MTLINDENKISAFCGVLEGDKVHAVDTQAIVELEMNEKLKKWLNSPIYIDEVTVRRELVKLKTGRLLSWGSKFMRFINDEKVGVGTLLLFKNTDGDIKRHPKKQIFYKIIEGCEVEARFE